MKWHILCIFIFFCQYIHAHEYIYPVAVSQRGSFYLIYQKTPNHIELWEWTLQTNYADQLLMSRFTPAGFQLLPDEDGFSFIDNGILKIKKWLKRSPRTIEFDAPIYQVEVVHWLDNTTCYTSGKYKNNFGIFQIDYEGEVTPIYLHETADCMYPQKVYDELFYIERDHDWNYRIMQAIYEPALGKNFEERHSFKENQQQDAVEIIDFKKQPIVFLSMVSESEGFVVGHPPTVNRTEQAIYFEYYHLKKENDWHVEKLFSFNIPADLLFVGSPARLYESILPLLPRHYATKIMFTTADNTELSLSVYDLISKSITKLSNTKGLFPPVNLMSGGELTEDGPTMGIGKSGGVAIELVNISM